MNERMKRWDFSLEGKLCPKCRGKREVSMSGDLHQSAGIIPCPMGYFQGHGYPTCGKDGRLHFSEYDIEHKDFLMKEFPSEEENEFIPFIIPFNIPFLRNLMKNRKY